MAMAGLPRVLVLCAVAIPCACATRSSASEAAELAAESEPSTLLHGESELIFIRHGVSLNNVFKKGVVNNAWSTMKMMVADALPGPNFEEHWRESEPSPFKSGYEVACGKQKLCGDYESDSSLSWEILRWSRDCLLHPSLGEEPALALREKLKSKLPEKIDKVYVSPLRRTLQTGLTALGPWMTEENTEVLPWIHESYKSDSDLANDGDMNSRFLERYLAHLEEVLGKGQTLAGPVHALQRGLDLLGKGWVDMSGSAEPSVAQPDSPVPKGTPNSLPLYPGSALPGFQYAEGSDELEARMEIVRRFLKQLPVGRYAFVSHGGISKALFGKKAENLAVITARWFNDLADPKSGEEFFHDIKLAQDRYGIEDMPGWE